MKKRQKRRRLGAALAASFLILVSVSGCAQNVAELKKTDILLDTVVSATLYGSDQETLDGLFDEIRELNGKLNSKDSSSELSRANEGNPLSQETFEVIEHSYDFSKISGGVFDPALGALTSLWDVRDQEEREAPAKEQVEEARAHSGAELITLDEENRTVSFSDPDASLDLGASAKGFIGEQAKAYLKENGVHSALLSLGGNIVAIGAKPDGSDFLIGIENPKDPGGELLGTLSIKDESVVTSGDYQRYFTDSSGTRYHHILDPETGYPSRSGLSQVVVVCENGETADLLSTTLFIMGLEKGEAFMRSYDPEHKIGVIYTEQDGKTYVTENLKDKFTENEKVKDEFPVTYIQE